MVSYVARLAKFALVDHANVGRLHLVLGKVLGHIALHHLIAAVAFANVLHLLNHVLIL